MRCSACTDAETKCQVVHVIRLQVMTASIAVFLIERADKFVVLVLVS